MRKKLNFRSSGSASSHALSRCERTASDTRRGIRQLSFRLPAIVDSELQQALKLWPLHGANQVRIERRIR